MIRQFNAMNLIPVECKNKENPEAITPHTKISGACHRSVRPKSGYLIRPNLKIGLLEYGNDFAEWVRHSLHDAVLAERLGVVDPSDFETLELMRQSLIETTEERLDETEMLTWAPVDRQYQFIRSQIVVFNTDFSAQTPEELAAIIPELPASSVFYHFIDARQRLPDGGDDFRAWLSAWDERYADLQMQLASIDPYFTTLSELRDQVARAFANLTGAGS